MAHKRNVRASLAEIASQPGRFIVVSYEDVEQGAYIIKAPRPRTHNDVLLEDLVLWAFRPIVIDPEWLSSPTFEQVYNTVPAIRVWRQDVLPDKGPSDELPEDLDRQLTPRRRQLARAMAYTPYKGEGRKQIESLINMNDREASPAENYNFLRDELVPFLQAFRLYEARVMDRQPIVKMIDERLESIARHSTFRL